MLGAFALDFTSATSTVYIYSYIKGNNQMSTAFVISFDGMIYICENQTAFIQASTQTHLFLYSLTI